MLLSIAFWFRVRAFREDDAADGGDEEEDADELDGEVEACSVLTAEKLVADEVGVGELVFGEAFLDGRLLEGGFSVFVEDGVAVGVFDFLAVVFWRGCGGCEVEFGVFFVVAVIQNGIDLDNEEKG